MLWDIIRDFFVQYIFGGITSNDEYFSGLLGYAQVFNADNELEDTLTLNAGDYSIRFLYDNGGSGFIASIGLADWLSTTATIITLCAICVSLFFFVRWLFRLTAGLISGRG